MRIDYNVLWVEDNQSNVQSQKRKIDRLIRKEGFRLNVKFAESVESADTILENGLFGDNIDLVMMDYDLGTGVTGDQGVRIVRDRFPFKDIVFYSGRSTKELFDMVAAQGVQGVFVCHRDSLPDDVLGIFENIVRKIVDLDHARGIVMGATSEIDHLVSDLLDGVFSECSADQQAAALALVAERLKQKEVDFAASIKKISAISHLSELSSHYGTYTSDDRLRLLRKLLNSLSIHQEMDNRIVSFREEVVPNRNRLAHARGEVQGFLRVLKHRDGTQVSSEDVRDLRLKLLEFQEILEALVASRRDSK